MDTPERPPPARSETIHVRLPPKDAARVERVRRLAEERAGVPVRLADVVRDLIRRGLDDD